MNEEKVLTEKERMVYMKKFLFVEKLGNNFMWMALGMVIVLLMVALMKTFFV